MTTSRTAIEGDPGRRTTIRRSARGESRWEIAVRAPAPALQRHVRGLVGYEEWSPSPRVQRRFPHPLVVVVIEIGPPLQLLPGGDARRAARHPGGFVAGLGDVFALTEHAGRQCGIQVDLTPTGARRLLGLPLAELAGGVVSLHDVMPRAARVLVERLAVAPDWPVRLDLVETFLASRLLAARVDTARVDWAVSRIEASGGRVDVGGVARELGHSHKHLIALFRDQVGIPPRLLARLVRLARVVAMATAEPPMAWAELAIAEGYADQAHLAREVRRFTGLTPTELRASAIEVADLHG